ncbi:Fic family protein [Haliscomenobacter sp.]|uniref:Fic family protein n=1 Tax=Haliscomenobacter sp. TaxID=2717303 RepID=UPI0033650B79
MSRVLVKVARDLKVGTAVIVDYLNSKGFDIENKPNMKITDPMYDELLKQFQKSIESNDDSKTETESYRFKLQKPKVLGKIDLSERLKQRIEKVSHEPVNKRNEEKTQIESNEKVFRLWKFIQFDDSWNNADTSTLDDLAPSWFARREVLQTNSHEYEDFLNQLKREHAIETGIVERLYDLKKGITETFIKEGFVQSFLSHDDTNVPAQTLMSHLKDHLEAVDFIFDIVKEDRPFTKGFIKELHQLVTRSQIHAEGRDQFRTKIKIDLLKGAFKTHENNPTREDGTLVLYCPPEHVEAEMDRLIDIYNKLVIEQVHAIVISSWVHHAFTTIHPFQDGNGRVARLLASLILIKFNFFPFTVLREEAKVKYIRALEAADNGNPQSLVDYFSEVQKRNIEKALSLRDVNTTTFEEVASILKQKVQIWKKEQHEQHERVLSTRRLEVFEYCHEILNNYLVKLRVEFGNSTEFSIGSSRPDDFSRQHYYYNQIIQYATKHDYYFNISLPKSWLMFRVDLSESKRYQLGITIHHYGYDDSTIAVGAFLEFKAKGDVEEKNYILPLDIKPHVISIYDDFHPKKKNLQHYLEQALTLALAQIASEF